jgi:hypothetical protein
MLDAAGAPIGVQQKLMRHAHVSTTLNVYGNAFMEGKREAHGKVVQMVFSAAKQKGHRCNGGLMILALTHTLCVGLRGVGIC